MARRKTIPVPEAEWVTVTTLVSFNGLYAGDRARAEYDDRVKGWERAGLVKVERDGESQAGPGTADQDDSGGVTAGAGDGSPSGDEPGEGVGAG